MNLETLLEEMKAQVNEEKNISESSAQSVKVDIFQFRKSFVPILKILDSYQNADWQDFNVTSLKQAQEVVSKAWMLRNKLYDLLNQGLPAAIRGGFK